VVVGARRGEEALESLVVHLIGGSSAAMRWARSCILSV
jgi:hypothetical protein